MIKIAIVGPESTGKSELAQQLAAHYKCPWVPEYARTYLQNLGRPYAYPDLKQIAIGQITLEEDFLQTAAPFLFCDTTLLVIKIWSEFKYGKTDAWILKEHAARKYDHFLLCNIDLPWQPDPLREHPHKRKELFTRYEKELKEMGVSYNVVSGLGKERLKCALKVVEGKY